ncbi:replication initiator protein A [Planococcus sp. 1R117A]|uniref:replication initiator protein A n=1 Tax=Planococcus sp. 1R117A TaxID=3447020 RepID=UPI003EDC3662
MTKKYNVQEEAAERFFRLPKVFFTNERYKKLSNDAKIAFAILQDRLELSIRNRWFDEEGNIFFLYGNQQLAEILNCSKPTVIKIKKELHAAELLEEKRMGLSQSNRLYLLKPVADPSDVEEWMEPVTKAETLAPQQKLKSFTSRNQKPLLQEVKSFNTNDTELNKTDFNETEDKINQEISKLKLPDVLMQVLLKNKKRLMDDQIQVEDIANHYHAHQNLLNLYQYADALQYSLERTPGRIKSITARLTKAVEDKKKWLTSQERPVTAPVREELVPEWLHQAEDEMIEQRNKEALEAEKAELLRRLEMRKSL